MANNPFVNNYPISTVSPAPVAGTRGSISVTTPLSGIVDNSVNLIGELREVVAGQTGNYSTAFAVSNNHVYIEVVSITGTGTVTINGTSLDEYTAVPKTGDVEVLTIDDTVGQRWQTSKKWWEVTSIAISGFTAINYNVGVVGYSDLSNIDYSITGFRLDSYLQSNSADLELQLIKIQDDGGGRMSIVYVEQIGFDSGSVDNQIVDKIRIGLNDRSYNPVVDDIGLNNTTLVLKQGDYDTYYTLGENVFNAGSGDEGLIIRYAGSPSGGISGVDFTSLRVDYKVI